MKTRNLKNLCAGLQGTGQVKKSSFFLTIYIHKYIYNLIENLIRNIEIDYFYFIFNIEIISLFLQDFSIKKTCTIFSQKHEDGTHLFVGRIL
jgi:hypothetical protein